MTNGTAANPVRATRAIAALSLLLHLALGPTLVLAQETTVPVVPPPAAAQPSAAPVAVPPPEVAPAMLPPPDAAPPPAAPTEPPPMAAPPMAAPPMAAPPMPPITPEPMPMPPAPPQPSKIPAYILWGAGGASLIVGTIFGISTLTAKSHFDDHPTYSGADAVHNRSISCDVGLGLGIILALAGTVFYVAASEPVVPAEHADKQTNSTASLRPIPVFSSRAGGGVLTLHF